MKSKPSSVIPAIILAALALSLALALPSRAATITWTNVSSGGWSFATNWSPNQVPSTNDTAIITNGQVTVTLNGTTPVGGIILGASGGGCGLGQTLSLAGQTLNLYGPLTINTCGHFTVDSGSLLGATNIASITGAIGWTAGTLAGTLTLTTNSVMTLGGTGNLDFPNTTLTNFGTVTWTNGIVRGGSSGTYVYNYGLWDAQGDLLMNSAYNGAGVSFYNFGTLRKSAGTNSTIFAAGVGLASSGNVDARTGILSLQSGASFTGGTVTNLSGLVQLAIGSFNFTNTLTTTNVQLYSALTGTNVLKGSFSWLAGNWDSATVTIASNCLLVIAGGGGNMDLQNAVVTNLGTVAWSSGILRGGNTPGTFAYNYGVWDSQGDVTFDDAFGGSGTTFYNYGTLRKSAGTNSTVFAPGVGLADTGPINVQTGSLVLQGGGAFTNCTINGAGNVDFSGGSFNLAGTVVVSGAAPVYLNSGSMTGSNAFMSGSWNWDSSGFAFGPPCALTLATNGVLTVDGGGEMDVFGTLTNAGTIRFQAGNLRPRADQGAGQLINLPGALVDFQADVNMDQYAGGTFINEGILRKSGGTNGSAITLPIFNSGPLDVESSYLSFTAGGNLNPGTTTIGPDLAYFTGGTFTLSGSLNLSNTVFNGSPITGTNAVISGNVLWDSGGSYFAPFSVLTLASNCVLTVNSSGDNDIFGALTNAGTIRLQAGNLRPRADQGAGQLINLPGGLVDFQADVNMDQYAGGTFINQGILRKSGGTNGSAIIPFIYNSGPVDVESSYLNFTGGGNLNPGTTTTGSGLSYFTSSTYTLSGNLNLNNTVLNGSQIAGTNVVISGNVTWDTPGSYFVGSSTLTLASNCVLTVNSSSDNDIYGVLTNAGTIRMQAGNLRPRADQGPGQLINLPGALVDFQADVNMDSYAGGTFINQGTFRKSGGTNGSPVNAYIFNSGAVDVESSYFNFVGGASLMPGTVLTGPDNSYFSSSTITLIGNVNLNHGVFNGSLIDGTNGVISGNVTWDSSGSYFVPSSTLTLGSNCVLTLASGGDNDIYGALTNAGTIQLVSGALRPRADQGPGQLINLPGGLVDLKSDTGFDVYASGTILNQGTFRKSIGTNSSVVSPLVFNTGTLDSQAGNIAFNGGVALTNGIMNFGISSLTNYGTISVAGAANLSNMVVSANLKNGYQPIATNTFNVLSFGSRNGIFAATNLPFADAWQTNYTATTFSLEVLNARPTLVSPTNTLTVDELTTLTATNTATDPDIPAQTLTFSLVTPPPGMTIGASSGILSWTPAQTNSPSTNTITVAVTDNGVPPLSISNSFTVIVREVNVAPSLPTITTQIVNELTLLTVTNTATNANIHATNIGYALIGAPAGMTITTNGVITWTPAQTNSPSTNTITTVVTNLDAYDLIHPNLTSSNTFTVIVREVNVAPTLSVISTQTVNELTLLTVTNTASEFNIHAVTSGYLLLSSPPGMTISANGIITWTPAQTNSPSTNTVTTVVTNTDNFDTINPHLASTNSFTVIVKEVNVAPTLSLIATQIVNELTLLTVTNAATNSNIHATNSGYGLINPPAGMVISTNGVITWTPAQTNSPSTNTITTVVTNTDSFDAVNPHLTATNTFAVIVKEVNVAPVLSGIPAQTVNELTLMTVTNTATESNIHATLGYVLVGAPAGAVINTNGIITWTPPQTNSPSTNIFTTIVTNSDPFDTVNPSLSATNSFTVTVKEVNVAPVLPVIATQAVNVNNLLTVTNTATESNIHATLGYVLVSPLAGMAINTNGIFTWTPNSGQSPSTNTVTTIVTNTDNFDTANPHLSATNSFLVIVSESNLPPVLSLVATQTVNELTLLTVTNQATEPNPHATTTGYGLINSPAGATISTNGIITWTPAQTNSPSTNAITTVVTNTDAFDAVNPHLTATNSFIVIVKEVNVAPTLSLIATQTVNELTLLTVTNTAGEFNIHATLAYTLVNPPAGMTINTNGIITWMPAQTNSPSTNTITTIVTNTDIYDTVTPHLAATNSFVVIVKEVNVAPVLPVIPTQTVSEQTLLTVVNTATESNIHATNLGYTLLAAPAGVSVSPNGIITWTPSHAQASTTNVITTVVSNTDPFDTVNPHLSATNSFTVIVKPAFILFSPTWLGNGQFQFSFNATAGVRYTIFYSTDLKTWVDALAFDGPGGQVDIIDPNAGQSPHRFYRVEQGQ